jgi:hypothetical protein
MALSRKTRDPGHATRSRSCRRAGMSETGGRKRRQERGPWRCAGSERARRWSRGASRWPDPDAHRDTAILGLPCASRRVGCARAAPCRRTPVALSDAWCARPRTAVGPDVDQGAGLASSTEDQSRSPLDTADRHRSFGVDGPPRIGGNLTAKPGGIGEVAVEAAELGPARWLEDGSACGLRRVEYGDHLVLGIDDMDERDLSWTVKGRSPVQPFDGESAPQFDLGTPRVMKWTIGYMADDAPQGRGPRERTGRRLDASDRVGRADRTTCA